jgi:hypothetical protein
MYRNVMVFGGVLGFVTSLAGADIAASKSGPSAAQIVDKNGRMDGTDHPTEIYFRNYRQVEDLQIPFVLETRGLPVTRTATGLPNVPVPPERIIIEKVVLNPKFDEALFSKPDAALAARAR